MNRAIAVLLTVLMIGMLGGCDEDNDSKEPVPSSIVATQTPEATLESLPINEEEPPQVSLPEGFEFPKEGIRPYAVMIDNEGKRPLPQGGLYKAQLVYEILAEGGVTRLMPVFWGPLPEMIGPVRSSRHYFLDYSMERDAIYIHFGYSPQAQRDLRTYKINNINGVANGGEIFYDLTKDKGNWQDSYTSPDRIQKYVEKVKYRTTSTRSFPFQFGRSDLELTGGIAATDIKIKYSGDYSCGYTLDPKTNTYLRFRQGKPQMERNTDKQLTAKNILVQFVSNHTISGDDKGRQEVSVVGNGSGWLICNGKAVKIKWSKTSRTEPTQYLLEDGTPLALAPGQTWIQIVPMAAGVTIQ